MIIYEVLNDYPTIFELLFSNETENVPLVSDDAKFVCTY